MALSDTYKLGKALSLGIDSEQMQRKLAFVLFPYSAKAVISTALIFLFAGLAGAALSYAVLPFFSYVLLYFGIVSAIVLYIYPSHIFYSQSIGGYNEEMLRAILRMTTYISMDTSIEYAVTETEKHLHGTLKLQFESITNALARKQKATLGDAIEPYIPVWNGVNPVFVKSFRLLQTAALSKKDDRDAILGETVETMLLNYRTLGKRYAEQLSNNSRKLVTVGVLIPIMSLMLLPLLSIFMPDLVRPSLLAFVYVILFPTVTLLMALNFGAQRVQVDTVHIEDAASYEPMPVWLLWLCIGIVVVFSVPTFVFVSQVEPGTANAESLFGLAMGWLASFGIVLGVGTYATLYVRRYKKLWNEVYEVEQDLPHLLQSFTTYLTLNIATENVIPEIIKDYERFGFASHPVVKAFTKLHHVLLTTKESILVITKKHLPKLLPSRKVTQILEQILSFSEISQRSSAKIAKMVRAQTMSVYKLDDYIKTMLAETVGLINVTTTLLAPLLSAAAVIMSVAIVKALVYITEQLTIIAQSFGSTDVSFTLVDTSSVVPPVFIEVVVGIYLVETILVMSFFGTQINVGNDKYKFFEAIKSNILGFVIYTVLLFGGYLFIVEVLFKGILLS